MIKCIAIDDEPKALDVISRHVEKTDFLELLATFVDPFKAITFLEIGEVDLIFLDINMPEVNGFQILKHLPENVDVVFTTAHSEYAIQSYEVQAVDYLLKPFDYSRFLLAVNKVKSKQVEDKKSNPSRSFIFVNTGSAKEKILLNEISFIESDGNYVHYHTKEKTFMVRASIKQTMEILSSSLFVQIHRSFIISLNWIDKIEDNHVFISDREIPIGLTYKSEFLKRIEVH